MVSIPVHFLNFKFNPRNEVLHAVLHAMLPGFTGQRHVTILLSLLSPHTAYFCANVTIDLTALLFLPKPPFT